LPPPYVHLFITVIQNQLAPIAAPLYALAPEISPRPF
jgi:hypothetical protein